MSELGLLTIDPCSPWLPTMTGPYSEQDPPVEQDASFDQPVQPSAATDQSQTREPPVCSSIVNAPRFALVSPSLLMTLTSYSPGGADEGIRSIKVIEVVPNICTSDASISGAPAFASQIRGFVPNPKLSPAMVSGLTTVPLGL